MVIIAKSALIKFADKHPSTIVPLMEWNDIVTEADWANVNDVKNTFNSADYVGNERFVFNIKGNHYRLIVKISYDYQMIWIRFIGTHAEYDKINAKTI